MSTCLVCLSGFGLFHSRWYFFLFSSTYLQIAKCNFLKQLNAHRFRAFSKWLRGSPDFEPQWYNISYWKNMVEQSLSAHGHKVRRRNLLWHKKMQECILSMCLRKSVCKDEYSVDPIWHSRSVKSRHRRLRRSVVIKKLCEKEEMQ